MYSLLTLFTLLSVATSAPLGIESRQTTTTCATGVHIIAARGSTQLPGEGSLQDLSKQLKAAIPGSTSTAVIYPATLFPYKTSEGQGVANMLLLIQQYLATCPKAKLVLTGYSQGAQIVGDTLGGGSFNKSTPLPEIYRKNILAAILFGDPSRTSHKSYNFGNSTENGMMTRSNTVHLDTYSSQLRSYCLKGDPVCDDEGFDPSRHGAEVPTFQGDALRFVVGLAGMR